MDISKISAYNVGRKEYRLYCPAFDIGMQAFRDFLVNSSNELVGKVIDIKGQAQTVKDFGTDRCSMVSIKRAEILHLSEYGQAVCDAESDDPDNRLWVEVDVSYKYTFDPRCVIGLPTSAKMPFSFYGKSYGYIHEGAPTVRIFLDSTLGYYERILQHKVTREYVFRNIIYNAHGEANNPFVLIGKLVRIKGRVGEISQIVDVNSVFADVLLKPFDIRKYVQ